MNNRYQQQLIDLYIKKCGKLSPNSYINTLEIDNINQIGYLRLNIVDQLGEHVPNATITIYVTDGLQRDIPVMHLITTINPILIALPMANDLGTLIVGPEYDFSTYNLKVDAFGYFSREIYNIRLFPNTTTDFEIDLIKVSQLEAQPLIEERIDIPPHLRDVINGV